MKFDFYKYKKYAPLGVIIGLVIVLLQTIYYYNVQIKYHLETISIREKDISEANKKVKYLNEHNISLQESFNKCNQQLFSKNSPQGTKNLPQHSKNVIKTIPRILKYSHSGRCGAITKKGSICQRKVKGGGRCYQH